MERYGRDKRTDDGLIDKRLDRVTEQTDRLTDQLNGQTYGLDGPTGGRMERQTYQLDVRIG